jgi:membrane protease YdiL (CAAX protease family)
VVAIRTNNSVEIQMIRENRISRSVFVVLKGFGVLIIAHAVVGAIGVYYLGPKLVTRGIPLVTIAMLSSSATSALFAITYLKLTTNYFPIFKVKKEIVPYVFAGVVATWIVSIMQVFFLGKESAFIQDILKTSHLYYYLNLFLFVLWGPLLEETLYRGYFFEILRRDWGNGKAFLLSSILFVFFHGLWGVFNLSLLFIFFYSAIFTLLYIEGGLVVPIIVHSFTNFYLAYLNMP